LGDKWTVEERKTGSFTATRKVPVKPDSKLSSKVADELKSIRDDYKGAMASYHGEQVALRGRVDDCGDIPKLADKFAKIDGINRITVDLTCAPEHGSLLNRDNDKIDKGD